MSGGIKVLPEAFPARRRIWPDSELVEIETGRRRGCLPECSGRTEEYDRLIDDSFTELVRRCVDLPRTMELAESLRWVSVHNVNLAVARERISDKHWIIMFPEHRYPFYRLGSHEFLCLDGPARMQLALCGNFASADGQESGRIAH